MSENEASGVRRFFTNPLVYIIAVVLLVLWSALGFRPFGSPEGEYVCDARSGVQQHPISVFHVEGQPMKVIEYRPGEAVDISRGMTYGHSLFERHLTLNIASSGETYRCELVS